MLIAFEGLDNSGKTIISERLSEELKLLGYDVGYDHEFETLIGKNILILNREGSLDPITKTFLFACDRHIRLKKYTESDFENKIIIFDRYVPSAVAYRMAENIERSWVENVNSVFPVPDLTFYIDITADESIKRRTPNKQSLNYTEEELNKVREAYLSIFGDYNMVRVDGMRPFDEVYDDVWDRIKSRLYV